MECVPGALDRRGYLLQLHERDGCKGIENFYYMECNNEQIGSTGYASVNLHV